MSISLLALVNLCLSASGRFVVNNVHCRNWPGGCTPLVMSNSVLSITMLMVSSSRWGSFFGVVDIGLRVKLNVL